jgi:hypothetical protein
VAADRVRTFVVKDGVLPYEVQVAIDEKGATSLRQNLPSNHFGRITIPRHLRQSFVFLLALDTVPVDRRVAEEYTDLAFAW